MRAAERALASPRARRDARARGIDLAGVRGSGPAGRIVAADVARLAPGEGASAMRRAIARRTTESAATIPHFHLRVEVDITALQALRRELKGGVGATLTDLLLRAMSLALAEVPAANRVWRDDRAVSMAEPAVGLVVALDEGLAIPVLRPAALAELVAARIGAVARARAGKTGTEAACASTLSNLGPGRVDEFSAIIPLGQSSILAVGRAAPRPWVEGGAFVVRETLKLCLSADHRVLDGRPAADYLGRIAELLEKPRALAS
jgi:pyruvate dehydrogenase E2 component (dihydrolipoamide acetyltransferase)